jgi:hypothetical protein
VFGPTAEISLQGRTSVRLHKFIGKTDSSVRWTNWIRWRRFKPHQFLSSPFPRRKIELHYFPDGNRPLLKLESESESKSGSEDAKIFTSQIVKHENILSSWQIIGVEIWCLSLRGGLFKARITFPDSLYSYCAWTLVRSRSHSHWSVAAGAAKTFSANVITFGRIQYVPVHSSLRTEE